MKNRELTNVYSFRFVFNPFHWFAALFNVLWQVFVIPSKITRLIQSDFKVCGALCANKSITLFQKIITTIGTNLIMIFWMLPRIFIYPAIQLLFLCVFIDFKVNRCYVDEDGNIMPFKSMTKEEVDEAIENFKSEDFKGD